VRYQAALRPDNTIKYIIAANIRYWYAVFLSNHAIFAIFYRNSEKIRGFEPVTGNTPPSTNNKKVALS
jgi:hypothetical protein